VLTATLALAGIAATPAHALPIDQFILYGADGVFIGAGSRVTGAVGAESNGNPGSPATAIKLNGGAQIAGDAHTLGNTNLQNNAHITGDVYHLTTGAIQMGAGSTVGGDQVGDVAFVGLPGLPAASQFNCPTGGANLSGANGKSLSLSAGSYGTIQYGSGFALTLTNSGTYVFDSLKTANGAQLTVLQPPVQIFVCDSAQFGSVDVAFPNTPSPTNADLALEVHGTGANAVQMGGGSNWTGDIFAPLGEIHFGGGGCCSSFLGRFWANQIDLEHSVTGTFVDVKEQPTPKLTKDATLLHGQKQQNNGANLSLRVAGPQIGSLVGFDVAGLDLSKVTKAELILTVCYTPGVPDFCPDPPSNWVKAGGEVYAYRLFDGFENWAEGNGNNFPIKDNPRGDGLGITWNCSTDIEVSNEKRDCSGVDFWSTGGYDVQGPGRGPVLHTNSLADGDKLVFDVTFDVQAGFGQSDSQYMSWFIRKPSGSGQISYYSREGAAAAGDPGLAAQLVLTLAP
jgi:hypothetical protein